MSWHLRCQAVVLKGREELAIKLLLVEDDDDIREVLTLALHLDSDIQLISYGSGEAALADIEKRQLAFDIAL
ncbi:hypothetical protein [Novosphingobium sp. JCM 18896]|uniref:hypothetical protein n=1 Tax=Novosphingobium sp. JCM 18896 TaxID=2989731 RepID=UPI0022221B73|nr:hypothetical protein [Novosphingobium sp. JCM 18896]MCW1432265.1 hypothetical protein [Novosphingobium sp. JCM 18896]